MYYILYPTRNLVWDFPCGDPDKYQAKSTLYEAFEALGKLVTTNFAEYYIVDYDTMLKWRGKSIIKGTPSHYSIIRIG